MKNKKCISKVDHWDWMSTRYGLKLRFVFRRASSQYRRQCILLKQMRGWGIGGYVPPGDEWDTTLGDWEVD
jgi:hypothetical protein